MSTAKQKKAAENLQQVVNSKKAANESKVEKTIDASLRIETRMIPFNEIEKLDQNPRGNLTPEGIAELADSLMTEQIQDLGAIEEDGKVYVFLGYRRLAAFAKNVEDGRIEENYPIRVTIWNVSRKDAFMMAFTENVLREEMTPLDECDGVGHMIELGYSEREIVKKTGLSTKKVSDYILVSRSAPEIRELVANKKRTIGWASSVAKMSPENTSSVLSEIRSNPDAFTSIAQLEKLERRGRVPVENALFDVKTSGLETTSDLFTPDLVYFADTSKFWAKQNEAIEKLKASLEERGHNEVEVLRFAPFPKWKYEDAESEQGAIAVIHLSSDGKVEVYDKLINPTVVEETTELSHIFGNQNSDETNEEEEVVSRGICEIPPSGKLANAFAKIRCDAAASVILENDDIAKRVALWHLMGSPLLGTKKIEVITSDLASHEMRSVIEAISEIDQLEAHIDNQPLDTLEYLLTLDNDTIARATRNYTAMLMYRTDGKKMIFGAKSPARHTMDAAKIDLRSKFTPKREFFEEIPLANLREIAQEVLPAAEASMASVTAKNDLVTMLTETFEEAEQNIFDSEYSKVNEWKPDYL